MPSHQVSRQSPDISDVREACPGSTLSRDGPRSDDEQIRSAAGGRIDDAVGPSGSNHHDLVTTAHPNRHERSLCDWTAEIHGPSRQPGEALPGGRTCPSLLILATSC
jgi:hypothetical protein